MERERRRERKRERERGGGGRENARQALRQRNNDIE